jgi:histidinol-phosphate aminotransferase
LSHTVKAGTAELPVNPHIAALPVYQAGMNIEVARGLSGKQHIAALASNENPNGTSPKVREALAALDPSRYSDPASAELKAALSAFYDVSPDRIVVGNGSEELIAACSRAVLVEGATAVTIAPSFGLHELDPLATGARVVKVPMTEALDFDVRALEAAIRAEPRLVFLSTPANPAGRAMTRDQLARILAALSPRTLFVLDEAYFEFIGGDTPDGLAMLRETDASYVVLRTFSKAYGLAGLRVGYGICSSAAVAQIVGAATPPFNVNSASQAAAVAALADQEWMKAAVASICAERTRVAKAIADLGLFAPPSEANFLFIRTPLDSAVLFDAMLANGIIVKPWREAGYQSYIRASIGTVEDNNRLVTSLKTILGRTDGTD